MGIQQTAPGKRNEDTNRACRVGGAREEQQVGAGPNRRESPLLCASIDDVEGVRDRHALEPEAAQEAVGARLECRSAIAGPASSSSSSNFPPPKFRKTTAGDL